MRIKWENHIDEALKRGMVHARNEIAKLESGGATPAWFAEVAKFEAQQAEYAFATEGAKSGAPWAQLSPRYKRWKSKVRPDRKILTFDGKLRDSLRHISHGDHIARSRGVVFQFGTRHRLAQYHQDGTPRMPARPPVRKTATQVQHLKLAIARAMMIHMAQGMPQSAVRWAVSRLPAQMRPDPRA